MKKTVCLIFSLIFVFSLSACGKSPKKKTDSKETVSVSQKKDSSEPDIDITGLNKGMTYSRIMDICNNIDTNRGKVIRMSGMFYVEETANRNYYMCLTTDTTSCCQVGFEFALKDTNLKYPDDFPKLNDEITVQGKLRTYNEGEKTYNELCDAVFIKK